MKTPTISELPGEQATEFTMQRLGTIVEPEPNDPREIWGVCNPAAARGRDGTLYLFPRLIAQGNYSRIGMARVLFDSQGRPAGVQRLRIALEPTESYEWNVKSGGGCEDPRIVYLRPLDVYVMTYTAYTMLGPRIALAISKDLFTWQRLGLLRFAPGCPVNFNAFGNKDGLFFPDVVIDEHGRQSFAIIHRPTYLVAQADGTVHTIIPPSVTERRQSLWMSHLSAERALADPQALTWVEDTHLLATPEQPWENIKVGGGTPPVLTRHGWLIVYHGVSGHLVEGARMQEHLQYSAGVLILDARNPSKILYRSRKPLLTPTTPEEREGFVPNIVFPTGIDQRPEADDPEGFDVYYGMTDTRIGVARLHIPAQLP